MNLVKYLWAIIFIILIVGSIALANINLDQYKTLVTREKTLQEYWVALAAAKDNDSISVIKLQSLRVSDLETRLNNAKRMMQDAIEGAELREKLLVSTAEDLETQINLVAEANRDLDKLNKTFKVTKAKLEYERAQVTMLRTLLDKTQKELKEFKKDLK